MVNARVVRVLLHVSYFGKPVWLIVAATAAAANGASCVGLKHLLPQLFGP